ncbi:MAG TPA: vanadium-dependent haloperoxidase [Solirubrobacteraceae bacterium]|nr:vanadium-dependent haloperoxidase [Solirubrobacteraceae bacterium]
MHPRRLAARRLRDTSAEAAFLRPHPEQHSNGDETRYPKRIANFSKGLSHNKLGEVEPGAYHAMVRALTSTEPEHFEEIPLAGKRKLTSPQAGLAFDLEGPDAQSLAIRPAPRFASAENAAEMVELYWMALLRDVRFTDYEQESLASEAAKEVSGLTDFLGARNPDGKVTPTTLFRGTSPGDEVGPYLSQFLLRDFKYGTLRVTNRQQTVQPKVDYLTDYDAWLGAQNGADQSGTDKIDTETRRYIRNGRDLAHYVHFDQLYEAYLNACLYLLQNLEAPFDPGNPYSASKTQAPFATFGGPHILSLVTEVATRALKAIWFQKWVVHRRLRPEVFGGRIHNAKTNKADYPIHPQVLDSKALDRVFDATKHYLLPQAFPEGSPTHPAYGAGHATVAGACVTILKAWFDESHPVADPKVPNEDGTKLVDYPGKDKDSLTVGGELNKVAANIAIGRNMGGVHWLTDYSESIRLGERVALGLLEEQRETYNEDAWFTVETFDGNTVTI